MGAVQRHNFEIVRKGYDPDAVDDVILELTIAKNDAEALVAKLQKQAGVAPTGGAASTDAARIIADAKQQARQIVDEAHRQAESTLGGARAEAHRVLSEARTAAIGTAAGGGAPEPATIRRLLALAERFESQVTALAKGALADTSSLTRELEQTLAAAATRPATEPAPARRSAETTPPAKESTRRPARAAIPEDEGDSTLDLLRKRSSGGRSDNAGDDTTGKRPAPVAAETDTRLAARIAREAERDRAASNESIPDPLPGESTSLASRIARERGSAASEEQQDSERGSYYSRRSARLPRIGEEATAGAMAAVRSVRKGGEGAATDDERTAQTA